MKQSLILYYSDIKKMKSTICLIDQFMNSGYIKRINMLINKLEYQNIRNEQMIYLKKAGFRLLSIYDNENTLSFTVDQIDF
ncbi:hypothetical protein pb186bvf_016532 [Paramecium bursaria]